MAMLVVLLDDPTGEFSLSQDLVASLAQLGVADVAPGAEWGGRAPAELGVRGTGDSACLTQRASSLVGRGELAASRTLGR